MAVPTTKQDICAIWLACLSYPGKMSKRFNQSLQPTPLTRRG